MSETSVRSYCGTPNNTSEVWHTLSTKVFIPSKACAVPLSKPLTVTSEQCQIFVVMIPMLSLLSDVPLRTDSSKSPHFSDTVVAVFILKAVIKCLLVAKMCSRASGLCAWFKMKSLSVRASARLPHTYWDHRCSHPQCGVLLNPGLTHSFRFDVDIGSCWRIISSSCTGGHVGWWRQPQPGASYHLSRLGVSGLNNITHPEARFIQVPFKVMTAGWINGVMSCLLFSCSSISDA